MKKTREQLIFDFKKSNKERRLKIAMANGFSTPDAYLISLAEKKSISPPSKKASKMKGTFYIIDVLDASGSMFGGKYENSKKGIIDGIKDLIPRKGVRYSLIEFIESGRGLNHPVTLQSPSDVLIDKIKFAGPIGGDTPLYKTIYDVISTTSVKKEDKVLINVYTDGGNNAAYNYTSKAALLIKEVQKKNFTITFVATDEDLRRITHDINIEKSNTFAIPNTPEGFANSMIVTNNSRVMYFSNAYEGEETLVGFYKQEGTL